MQLTCLLVVSVCSVVSTSNFVFAKTEPGYLEIFLHGADFELNFMNSLSLCLENCTAYLRR